MSMVYESMRQQIVDAEALVEQLRTALLNQIRRENGCERQVLDPARCTGWHAGRCGCAAEARASLRSPGQGGE